MNCSPRPARRHVGALIALATVLALFTGCAEKRVSEGIYLAHRGDYDEAITSFRAALERAPDSAIAHYNLGYALSAAVRDRALSGRFDGALKDLREANTRFGEAIALDPDTYTADVATAKAFNFSELYNIAIDKGSRGRLDEGESVLLLAVEATDDALDAQRARVLGLQIEMSRALASKSESTPEIYMRVLADLERIKQEGPADDTLVDEIENTLARARALLTAEQR